MNKPAAISGLIASARLMAARLRHGRPWVLAGRVLGAFALAEVTLHSGAGPAPEAAALTGIMTWLALTAAATSPRHQAGNP